MISVSNLTKFYGDYAAVEDLSFEVPRGQVVGFLGVNGAGKTTTMRILAGYLTATSGKAVIDGYDVFWNPIEVRRRIGYMPENCPLYTEMRVIEYLRFRAGVKELSGQRKKDRVEYVLDRCWLSDVRRQVIGTLSKGYRQRVGLADALLADPPVLILDEPTAGLDPTQIRSTRKLIRELGEQHTILLSTHILPEVEMTGDRVIIIHKGRVAESRSLKDLAAESDANNVLVVYVEGEADTESLGNLPDVTDMTIEPVENGNKLRIVSANVSDLTPTVCSMASEKGWRIRELRPERQTLEDIFVRITGRDEGVREELASA